MSTKTFAKTIAKIIGTTISRPIAKIFAKIIINKKIVMTIAKTIASQLPRWFIMTITKEPKTIATTIDEHFFRAKTKSFAETIAETTAKSRTKTRRNWTIFLNFMFYLTRNVFKKYSVFVSTSKITNLVRLLYELKGTVSREKFSNWDCGGLG